MPRTVILLAIIIYFSAACAAVAADNRPHTDNGAVMDVLGEFLRGINALSGGKKALPAGNPFLEEVRSKYEVPDRVQVLTPRGGSEIIVMVFDSEHLPVVEGDWSELSQDKYRYLQSYHNLEVVYCLYEKEPLDLDDVVVAIQRGNEDRITVYYNDKQGTVGSASIQSGNSIFFSRSRYIVRPVPQRGEQ